MRPRYCNLCVHCKQEQEGFSVKTVCALGMKKIKYGGVAEIACGRAEHIYPLSDEERTLYFDEGQFSNFEIPENWEDWKPCPKCGLKPLVWEFDNGRITMCGCGSERRPYGYFSIRAESIVSVYHRNNNLAEYESDGLKNNWNKWCETGEIVFEPKNGRW